MKKTIAIALAALACSTLAWAQAGPNPAEVATLDNGFIRIGEFRSVSRNNVGASSFLFPSGETLVTGLHSSVGTDVFPGGLMPVNSLYNQLDYNLVSYGWKGRTRGFHTVEVGVKGEYGLSVPREIFQILKCGTAGSPFDLSSLRAFGNLYGEIAYGYAFPLGDNFSVGTRVKLLVGLASVDVVAHRFDLTTSADKYSFDLDANVDITNSMKKIRTDEFGNLDYTSLTGKGKLGAPTGAGLALDFGLEWKPFPGFTLAASVLDLGGILWYYGNEGYSNGAYTFDGLKELGLGDLNADGITSRLKALGDEVLSVVRPYHEDGCFKVKSIPLTAMVKASYAMPFWERLSVGASGLYTGYSFCAPYWEARGGLALDFPEIFRLEANAGSGSYGFVYGVYGSVNFLSFKLYGGYENGIGGTVPYESTPLKANNKGIVAGLIYKIAAD